MTKQAISITLSPDNLLWLRGRARAEQLGSLSEYLDQLITRTRFGQNTPRAAGSMKGALADLAAASLDTAAMSPDVWPAWQARWDGLLAGVDTTRGGQHRGMTFGPACAPLAVAEGTPAPNRRRRRA